MATVTDVTALAVPPPRWQSGGAARAHRPSVFMACEMWTKCSQNLLAMSS